MSAPGGGLQITLARLKSVRRIGPGDEVTILCGTDKSRPFARNKSSAPGEKHYSAAIRTGFGLPRNCVRSSASSALAFFRCVSFTWP